MLEVEVGCEDDGAFMNVEGSSHRPQNIDPG